MALRPRRLPTLTLFTSGPLCSLCDVAKADLAAVQKQHPFHLKLYDIRRKQGDDPQEYERTAWRRLYQVRPLDLTAAETPRALTDIPRVSSTTCRSFITALRKKKILSTRLRAVSRARREGGS